MEKVKETITTKDKKWMYTYLDTEEEVNEVCNYLESNGLEIHLESCYDGGSGWHGKHVILEGRDLSVNGYCFNGKQLLNHVRNFKKYDEIRKSEEYDSYIKSKNKYREVEIFFNSIIHR